MVIIKHLAVNEGSIFFLSGFFVEDVGDVSKNEILKSSVLEGWVK